MFNNKSKKEITKGEPERNGLCLSSGPPPDCCQVLLWANTGYQFMSITPLSFFSFFIPWQTTLTVHDCNVGRAWGLCCFFSPPGQASKFFPLSARLIHRPPSPPETHLLMSCQMLQLCTSCCKPALRQHPGCLVVLTVASKQLKTGHCPRLSSPNPYTSPILINFSRLHSAPEGHGLCVCVLLPLVSILRSLFSVWSL